MPCQNLDAACGEEKASLQPNFHEGTKKCTTFALIGINQHMVPKMHVELSEIIRICSPNAQTEKNIDFILVGGFHPDDFYAQMFFPSISSVGNRSHLIS